eukprot:1554293-Amphidinium_carterae.1
MPAGTSQSSSHKPIHDREEGATRNKQTLLTYKCFPKRITAICMNQSLPTLFELFSDCCVCATIQPKSVFSRM